MPSDQSNPNKKTTKTNHKPIGGIDFSQISESENFLNISNFEQSIPNSSNDPINYPPRSTQPDQPNNFQQHAFLKKIHIKKSTLALSILTLIGTSAIAYCTWGFFQEGPEFIVNIIRRKPKQSEQVATQTTKLLCEGIISTQNLITYGNATSGTKRFEIIFQEGKLDQIIMTSELTYSDFSTAHTSLDKVKSEYEKTLTNITQDKKPFNAKYSHKNGIITTYHSIAAEQINDKNANFFEFPTENNQPIQDFNQIRRHYSKPSGSYNCQRQGARITQSQPQSQPQN